MSKQTIKELFEKVKRPTSKYDTYFDIYETVFSKFKDKDIVFVEIGILGGGSLEVWKQYFGPNSRIIGVDLNPELKEVLTKDGFEIYIGDQASPAFWKDFFSTVGKVDVILDDGGHTNKQQLTTLECSVNNINDGGIIVIEDVHASYMPEFGNPGKKSFIEESKKIIDIVNYRSSRVNEKFKNDKQFFSQYVFNVQYFESIVAFHIDSKLSKHSTIQHFGNENLLPNKEIPEDMRYKFEQKPVIKKNILERAVKKINTFFQSK